jgi:hypothetical protein
MSPQNRETMPQQSRSGNQPWEGRREPAPRAPGISLFELGCMAAIGFAVFAGMYFAPDIKRYLKIRNM